MPETRPGGKGKLPEEIRRRIRRLRSSSTDAEGRLWYFLRANRFGGAKFRRQHPVGRYVLDFYCHATRLAIEVDGGQHAEPSQARHDRDRERRLSAEGVRILRFWDHEVLGEIEPVLEAIWFAVFGNA